MKDPCCNEIIGGLVVIKAVFANVSSQETRGGGERVATYEGMGEVRIQPMPVSRASGASSGGHVWVTEAARPIRALLSFANRCDNDPTRLFAERCRVHITVYEMSRGFRHTLTDALIVGDAEVNLSTGEVTGIEIVCSAIDYMKDTQNLPNALAQSRSTGGGGGPGPTF